MKGWKHYLILVVVFLSVWILMAVGIRLVSGDIILGADYFTFYTAARMFLLDQVNPYSQEVTQAAQLGIIGRLATPEEDQMAFAYPLFMLFWVLPLAWLDISISQPLWMSLNILIALTYLIHTFQNKKIFAFLGLTFYPFVFGIILGNFSNLICFIFLYLFNEVIFDKPTRAKQMILGFLLAWTIGKPQLTFLVLLFAILVSVYKKYNWLIISFVITLATLLLMSTLILPNWMFLWIQRIQEYSAYVQAKPANLAQTVLSFTNIPEGIVLTSLLIGVATVFTTWFLTIKKHKNLSPHKDNNINLLFLNITIFFTIFIMPRTLSFDQSLTLIGLFLGSKFLIEIKPKPIVGIWLLYSILSWVALIFPIIANLSSTNILFPFVTSTSWLIYFWFLSQEKNERAIS